MENDDYASGSTQVRKPRIAIMGEFSSGKSTLSNMLLGSNPLPVQITATQLPPVWMSYGDQEPFREDLDGNIHPVDLDQLELVPLHETAVIRIFIQTDVLELCDIIDMPGISDPNMPPDIWERVIPQADGVLWCTHATQAWRQSEAAVWKSMPDELFQQSLLLITRIDKILNDRDRRKITNRVGRETDGLFRNMYPISLTQAVDAGEDVEKWEDSGAHEFSLGLISLIDDIASSVGGEPAPIFDRPKAAVEPEIASDSERDVKPPAANKIFHLDNASPPASLDPACVMPRRVNMPSTNRRSTLRPERPAPVADIKV